MISYSSSIDTDGLVFYYDMKNTGRCFKGAPTTNLLRDASATPLSTATDIAAQSTKTSLGNGRYQFVNTGTASTIRLYCNLSTLTNGQTYGVGVSFEGLSGTVSIDWCDEAVTGTASIASTTATSGRLSGYSSRANYSSTYRFLDIGLTAGGQVVLFNEQVDSIAIPTQYTESTRTNTQSVLDLTCNSIITASSLTYASDSFTFNGTSDYLSIPSIDMSQGQTIEIWLKPLENDANRRNPYNQSYSGYGTWTHETSGVMNYYFGDDGGAGGVYTSHTSTFTVAQNEVACLTATRTQSDSNWYKNGVFSSTAAHSYGVLTADSNPILIGNGYAGYYYGDIYSVKIYNRALTATNIWSNFIYSRAKYGL